MAKRDFDDEDDLDVSSDVNVISDDGDYNGPEDEDDAEPDQDDTDGDDQSDDEDMEASGDEPEGEDDDEDEGPEPLEPPKNWPVQEQQFFRSLPPALQHAYANRAQHMLADYTRKTQEIARVRQNYQDLERVTQPHLQKWHLAGMNQAQAVQQLIALSDFATNKPQEFIEYFANLRGINLNNLAASKQQGPQHEEWVDPQVAGLRQQVSAIQQSLNHAQQYQQTQRAAQERQQYVQAYQSTNANIDNFASQIGPDGKALYPHFNELEEDMAILISSGKAATLHDAYENAKWANPQVRSRLLSRARSQENAQQRRRVDQARRAASSIGGSGGGMNGYAPATDDMSTRDIIEAAWAGHLT